MAQAIEAIIPSRRREKSAAAFRTISEVSSELELPQHVLRFWETKFPSIQPLKRGGGRRYYRPDDMELLRRIRDLLYKDGYTIKGVQNLLRRNDPKEDTVGKLSKAGGSGALDKEKRKELKAVLTEMEKMRTLLRKAGA